MRACTCFDLVVRVVNEGLYLFDHKVKEVDESLYLFHHFVRELPVEEDSLYVPA